MATHRIKLTVSTPSRTWFVDRCVFAVKIEASDGYNVPDEIFLHRKSLSDPNSGQTIDEFLAISSAFELTTYPANAPQAHESNEFPFFRKSVISVFLPSVTKADEFIEEVKTQVETLMKVLDKLDDLQVEQVVYIPAEEPDEESPTTTTTPEP